MAEPHNRRIKLVTFDLDGANYECQLSSWTMENNTDDGDKMYTLCPDGEFREDSDDDYALNLTFFADWRSGGISDYLVLNDLETVSFQLDHHPDIPAEHVRWNGTVKIKAPSVGGDARKTETTEIKLQCVGKPFYSRPV